MRDAQTHLSLASLRKGMMPTPWEQLLCSDCLKGLSLEETEKGAWPRAWVTQGGPLGKLVQRQEPPQAAGEAPAGRQPWGRPLGRRAGPW